MKDDTHLATMSGDVLLDVELRGRVVVHRRGYRAEHQRVTAVMLRNGRCLFCRGASDARLYADLGLGSWAEARFRTLGIHPGLPTCTSCHPPSQFPALRTLDQIAAELGVPLTVADGAVAPGAIDRSSAALIAMQRIGVDIARGLARTLDEAAREITRTDDRLTVVFHTATAAWADSGVGVTGRPVAPPPDWPRASARSGWQARARGFTTHREPPGRAHGGERGLRDREAMHEGLGALYGRWGAVPVAQGPGLSAARAEVYRRRGGGAAG